MVGSRPSAGHAQGPFSGQGQDNRRFRSAPFPSLRRKPPSNLRQWAASRVEGWENRDRHEGIGAGAFGCPIVLRGVVEEGQDGGSLRTQHVQPPSRCLLRRPTRRWLGSRDPLAALGPDDAEERRVLEEALSQVRARATVAPMGSDWTSARNIANGSPSVSKKHRKWRERGELAEGQRRLVTLRAEAAAQPAPNPPHDARDRRVGPIAETGRADGRRVEVESPAVLEKSMVESSLKRQVEQHMSEAASLRERNSWGQEFEKRHWSLWFLDQDPF